MDKFLTMSEVCEVTTYSRPSIYRLMREGKFPKQVKLAGRRTAWRESTIAEWMKQQTERTA